ncbi:hypothetical protein B0H19DRAFT_380833 [Mycena capillaripes]|nr:hypothetical protein B0H19DRAFT_380833 [Mycena capillaripes]
MPDLFRGRDPDPTQTKKSRKRLLSEEPVSGDVSDSDDEDIDTAVILDTAAEDISQALAPLPSNHSAGTDLSRYFWPRYVLPVLSGCLNTADALAATGMKLTSLIFDPRKTIMNLTTVVVEFEPLLHTSPQIYTRKQWEGVMQVPRTDRGFKIGYAIEFKSHIMCWNTFDNNFRLHWRTPEEHAKHYEATHIPDVIFNYAAWCSYTVTWLLSMSRKSLKNLTILEVLSAPGRQPFRGLGRYGSNEVLSIAGIPGWVLISIILNDPVLFCIICEAFYQFVYERALGVEKYYKLPSARDADDDVDCSISATLKQQVGYIETLRTHGRARTHVSPLEAELIDGYNRASEGTWTENNSARDVFSKVHVVDFGGG